MNKDVLIQDSALHIAKDFGLQHFDKAGLTEETLTGELIRVVQYLLDKDLNKLLNILYRIDVNEADVRHILTTASPDTMAALISGKIMEREFQKAETRIRYST